VAAEHDPDVLVIGRRSWAIADGYLPAWSNGPEPKMLSHDAACILNAGEQDCHPEHLLSTDREPIEDSWTVPAQRAVHRRFNELTDPEPVPLGIGHACVIRSHVPIVVQHTHLDSSQSENAMTSAA
jgi:hypothetical protein